MGYLSIHAASSIWDVVGPAIQRLQSPDILKTDWNWTGRVEIKT
jgi:hypothetical protein